MCSLRFADQPEDFRIVIVDTAAVNLPPQTCNPMPVKEEEWIPNRLNVVDRRCVHLSDRAFHDINSDRDRTVYDSNSIESEASLRRVTQQICMSIEGKVVPTESISMPKSRTRYAPTGSSYLNS